jgi:anthranilate phosphoribosyltransferase
MTTDQNDAAVWKAAIAQLVAKQDLSEEQTARLFGLLMDGRATSTQSAGFLIALACKGETATELAGAATAMRQRAAPLFCDASVYPQTIDTCGTGGDGSGTVNISTLAAMMVAGCGGVVVKHGNRALSSKSGSADVLEALGIKIDSDVGALQTCLSQANIAFAFAPLFHPATKHVASVRKELGVRTIFNLLGPLTNPAKVAHQVVGVYSNQWCSPMAEALGRLGCRRAMVLHGMSGLSAAGIDEVSVSGTTFAEIWDQGQRQSWRLTPGDFGLEPCDEQQLLGGDAAFNADILRAVVSGLHTEPSSIRYAVTAAAAMTAGLALMLLSPHSLNTVTLPGFTAQAMNALRDGSVARVLQQWAVSSTGGRSA